MVRGKAWLTLVLVSLVGCGPTPMPTGTPSTSASIQSTVTPSPTFACTPEAGGSAASCTEQEHQRMRQLDAMYADADAEQTYRRFLAEDYRVASAGGATKLSSEFLLTIGGEKLRAGKLADVRATRKAGYRVRGGAFELKAVRRLAGRQLRGSDVGLAVCVDASSATVYQKGRRIGPSVITAEDVYFKRMDGVMKIWTNTNARRVEKCD